MQVEFLMKQRKAEARPSARRTTILRDALLSHPLSTQRPAMILTRERQVTGQPEGSFVPTQQWALPRWCCTMNRLDLDHRSAPLLSPPPLPNFASHCLISSAAESTFRRPSAGLAKTGSGTGSIKHLRATMQKPKRHCLDPALPSRISSGLWRSREHALLIRTDAPRLLCCRSRPLP